MVAETEKILLSAACDDQEIFAPDTVQEMHQSDISMDPSIMQFKLIHDLIQHHKQLTGVTINKIRTKIR